MENVIDALYGPDGKRVRMTRLLDIYGGLLSDRQRRAMDLSCNEDLSLSEIAEICGITRAGVHDRIVKSEAILEDAESRLGLLARSDRLAEAAERISSDAEKIDAISQDASITALAREIKQLGDSLAKAAEERDV